MTMTVSNINNLDDVAQVLEEQGYLVRRNGESMATSILSGERDFPVIFTIEGGPTEGAEQATPPYLEITCEIGKLADLFPIADPSQSFVKAMLALSLTTATPYGVGLLETADGLDDDDPVVLHNQVPLGDFSPAEMSAAMNSLRQALTLAVAKLGIKTD